MQINLQRHWKNQANSTVEIWIGIKNSVALLNHGECNVTEAAMSADFDDINCFCRVFNKYMKQSPPYYLQNDIS